ncbi:uncharacterized protein cd34 [Gouania willdenowi]|uniref:Uncharacterized LOC114467115 n=1 Tax=Gouania willdenowi TaxID=441366 RepID=A0A8C5N9Y6_GOUWI|nr:uncharacterized protein LOC114467115 [Gouania willdenowi]
MASFMWRMNGLCTRMAGVLVLLVLVLSTQVLCQDDAVTDAADATLDELTTALTPVDHVTDAPDAGAPPTGDSTTATANSGDNVDPTIIHVVMMDSQDGDNTQTTAARAGAKVEDVTMAYPANPGKNVGDEVTGDSSSSSSSSGSSVFVGILVSGLLAALAITIGYFKCQRRPEKQAVRLAEEAYPVDQDNQGNTLVSVAPLNPPPETPEKPSVNGAESPEADKTQTPPPTNGHSTAKAADTEL